jgi:tetraacyldisaccharide 4'-kinase
LNGGFKFLLYPPALLYGLATSLRNRLYDWRILKEHRFDVHTIGVGNLAMGGAGKTPLVEYLLRLLLREGIRVATLSRGYKRKTRGFVLADDRSTAEDIGDEPLIYKSKYNAEVAVDGRRVKGMRRLLDRDKDKPQVVLLDDVFQHRSMRCGLNILVTDFNHLFFRDAVFPAGTLREFAGGVRRADIIVISKTPDRTTAVEMRTIAKDINPRAHQRVFFSYLRYGELFAIDDTTRTLNTLEDLFRFRVISFAGIANAQPMVNYLKEYAAEVRHLPFPDHYEYSTKDLEDIGRYYERFTGDRILVTTEKDLMRLRNPSVWEIARRMNIYVLPVEVTFKDKEAEFNELVLKYVRTNRIYHQKYS